MSSEAELAVRLHGTTDASVWADEFCHRFVVTAHDAEPFSYADMYGLMVGWFANAIETGRTAGTES